MHTTNYVEKPRRHASGIIATPHVKILRFEAPLFFANIGQLRARVDKELAERTNPDAPDASKVCVLTRVCSCAHRYRLMRRFS